MDVVNKYSNFKNNFSVIKSAYRVFLESKLNDKQFIKIFLANDQIMLKKYGIPGTGVFELQNEIISNSNAMIERMIVDDYNKFGNLFNQLLNKKEFHEMILNSECYMYFRLFYVDLISLMGLFDEEHEKHPFENKKTKELFDYLVDNWNYDKQQKWADIYIELNESNYYKAPFKNEYEQYVRSRFDYVGKFQYDKIKKEENKDRQRLLELIREFS